MQPQVVERSAGYLLDGPFTTFPWFAIWVRGRSEKMVAGHLRARGYQPFLPIHSVRRQWSDRVRVMEMPLFPGYLFCRFDPRDRLPILTTPDVIQILGVGKSPLPVEDAEVEAIEAIVRSGSPKRPWPFLEVGQRVRIATGPLQGVEGILIEVRGKHRLVVSIELLCRSVAVEVDLATTHVLPLTPSFRPHSRVIL